MNKRLTQMLQNFTKNVMEVFSREEFFKVEDLENKLWEECSNFIRESITAYTEMIDEMIVNQKEERKVAGISIHKRKVSREYLSKFGGINFKRTYFKDVSNQGYEFLADRVVGIEAYDRISTNVAADLVDRAANLSYQRSAKEVVGGRVTRQTVLNKIRKTKGLELTINGTKKKLKVLHIVADEDHVALQNGKNAIVPLVTVHEGIKKVYKNRNKCISTKHFSEYGKPVKEFWDEISAWISEEYDVDNIERIYIHGDGAYWIKAGMDKLGDCRFVLDKYHLEKWIKSITSGPRREYLFRIRKAFRDFDIENISLIISEMLSEVESKEAAKTILDFKRYIQNNWEGIMIRKNEPECGGSCSEAQVSHVLSERLSRNPIGWCEEGLKYMSKLRVYSVNGGKVTCKNFVKRCEDKEISEMEKRVIRQVKELFESVKDFSLFELPENKNGKITPINSMFKSINKTGFAF